MQSKLYHNIFYKIPVSGEPIHWQDSTGREKIGGINVGFTEDPKLLNPGNGGNINNPYKLDTLTAYKTKPGSIIVENGLKIDSLFNNPGSHDFYGTTIPRAIKFDIGAYEDTSRFVIVDLTILIQGFYNSTTDNQIGDTVKLYLAESSSPYTIFDSLKSYVSTKGKGFFLFNTDILSHYGEDYYIVAKHRNSIETWSSQTLNLNIPSGRVNYDFTTDSSKAYGNNMIKKGSKWCIYSGDVNQDGSVDGTDVAQVDNDSQNFVKGYVSTDLNGDQIVDGIDYAIVEGSANNFISIISP